MKIKILALNIWGGELLGNVINFIRKEDPDIVLLQEVNDGENNLDFKYKSLSIIREKLNFPFVSFRPLFLNVRSGIKIPNGNAILSRFPIKTSSIIFFDIPFGEFKLEDKNTRRAENQFIPMGMLKASIEIDRKGFNVYNIHGIWGFDGKDNARRLEMSETIINEIKDKDNVILAGDFNLNPNTETIKNIEVYLQNVFRNSLISTFNMKHKNIPGYATAVVDMVLVSKHFQIINHYMSNVDVSDHMPLVCELEI